MPIYEYICASCGGTCEKIVFADEDVKDCPHCGSPNLRRMLSATSSASGVKDGHRTPGAGDTACCGSSPGASGCIPGSCCGRN